MILLKTVRFIVFKVVLFCVHCHNVIAALVRAHGHIPAKRNGIVDMACSIAADGPISNISNVDSISNNSSVEGKGVDVSGEKDG